MLLCSPSRVITIMLAHTLSEVYRRKNRPLKPRQPLLRDTYIWTYASIYLYSWIPVPVYAYISMCVCVYVDGCLYECIHVYEGAWPKFPAARPWAACDYATCLGSVAATATSATARAAVTLRTLSTSAATAALTRSTSFKIASAWIICRSL